MRRLMLIAVILVALMPPLSLAAQDNPIVFARDPQGPPLDALTLKLDTTATSTSTVFYVRYASPPVQSQHVWLTAQLFDADGQRVNDAAFTFTAQVPVSNELSVASVDATLLGFTLPVDSAVRVTLGVTNFNLTGTFTGTLLASADNRALSGPPLHLTRRPTAQLKLLGADDKAGYRLPWATAQFEYPFSIEPLNSTLTRLRVRVGPLVGPDGSLAEADWSLNGQPRDAEIEISDTPATLVVTATLPLTGTYTGTIVLNYDDQHVPTDLIVQRANSQLQIDVAGLQTARADLGLGARGDATVWFNLVNNGLQTSTLQLPALTALNLMVEDQVAAQADRDLVTVLDGQGVTLTSAIVIGPGQHQAVQLKVMNLNGAGEYQGTLRIAGTDAQPIERPIKIVARESATNAAGWILLGIIISTGLRVLSKSLRPRLDKQLRLRVLMLQLEKLAPTVTDMTADEQTVLNRLAERLRTEYDLVGLGQGTNTDDLIKEVEAKLPQWGRWINLRRRIRALQPPDLQKKLEPALQDIGRRLTEPSTTEQLTELETAIKSLSTSIGQEIKAAFDRQMKTLQDELEKAQAPQTLKDAAAAVTPLVDADKFAEAQAAFDKARRDYVSWLIDQFIDRIKTPPADIKSASWVALQPALEQQLAEAHDLVATQIDRALTVYTAAYSQYLQVQINELRERVTDMRSGLPTHTNLTDAQKNQLTQLLNDTLAALTSAEGKLKTPDIRGAQTELDRARTAFAAAQDILGVRKQGKGLDMLTVLLGVPLPAAPIEGASTPLEEIKALPSVSTLAQARLWLEVALFGLTLLIAVFFGLDLLWIKTPTWGGWAAYITAIMWGLGLHKVSEQTFEGLLSLREKVTKP